MDTPTPSPVNTDSGFFLPSSESTAFPPRGMSAEWTIATCNLKLPKQILKIITLQEFCALQ